MDLLHPLEELKKRPLLLSFLCILTIIGNAIVVLSGLFSLLALNLAKYFSLLPMFKGLISGILQGGSTYAITSIILSLFTIIGASQMWNMRKMGFYLYFISKIAFISVPFIFLVPKIFEFNVVFIGLIPYFILTIIFFGLYLIYIKKMHS